MATLTFLGAVEGVTGSMYLLESQGKRILLDCGLFQGKRSEEAKNLEPFPFAASDIDAVVLSHAHLDHSGRLPLLVADGFSGPIYMTPATMELINILLRDAASLQERDAEWENKRRKRAGKAEITPLFIEADVERTMAQCQPVAYHTPTDITQNISLTLADAGHILGSSIVTLEINEQSKTKRLVFSGDLGNSQAALLRDPDPIYQADVLLLESTYGDRDHRSMDETLQEFEQVLDDALENGGNILIPSFAVGRTQEIIFRLGELYQKGKLRNHLVFLDSPMAIAVTKIYHRYQDIYNQEDSAALKGTKNTPAHQKSLHTFLPILRFTSSTEESIALNRLVSGAIIIAGSGMCNGGRIRHHLKHNLWKQQAHVVFVGFQAQGTPGRALIDGRERVKMAGESIAVRAQIHTMGGFSAHASQSQLLEWLSHFKQHRPNLFLVHGEQSAKEKLEAKVVEAGWTPRIPVYGETITF